MTEDEAKTWKAAVKPISRQLRTAALIDCGFTYGPEGARSLARVIDEMADKLDTAQKRLEIAHEKAFDLSITLSCSAFAGVIGFGLGLAGRP